MFFRNETHKKLYNRFKEVQKIGNDREYLTAYYLLAAANKDFSYFLGGTDGVQGIRWDEIIKDSGVFSHGEIILIQLANNFFNGSTADQDGNHFEIDPMNIYQTFDNDLFQVFLTAFQIRMKGEFNQKG